jgi:hypothetical protein
LFDWSYVLTAGLTGGAVLAIQALTRALMADGAKRIAASVWGIRAFDFCTGWILADPVWSGMWKVTWQVESSTFEAENSGTGRFYRCFNSFALEGSGTTTSGRKLPYAFVGKFGRDKTIATGVWFDKRGGGSGYHGVFQMRALGDSESATGAWAGFSETTSDIKSDRMKWRRCAD